ncbi:MAG: hypothetical protein FWF41_05140 [Betaproteobacteria bacterium]|nr:hypothetical protein [Betaproteobacteria bacterium]
MKTLLRWIVRIVLGLLALVALFIAVLVAANWQDEPLTPEATRLLAPPAPTTDTPNAYYVLLGLDAPDDEDALTAGKRLRSEFNRQCRENPTNCPYEEIPRSKTISEPSSHWTKLQCRQQGTNNVDFYLSEKDNIKQLLAEQTLLRQRYQQLSQIPAFDEPPRYVYDIPLLSYYSPLTLAAEMRRMEAVLALDKDELQTGANILMEEIRVHRRLVAGSSQRISKMMFLALLRHDYEMLSDAIERWPALARQVTLTEALQPLREQEYSMRKVIESDAIWCASLVYGTAPLRQIGLRESMEKSWKDWIASLLILPNTTINVIARWGAEDIQASEGDTATIDARFRAYTIKRMEELKQIAPYASWRFIRNPSGKTLLSLIGTTYGFSDHITERIYDLDGYIRLVALQAALRRDNVPLNKVADYVQNAAPDLRNPYDGQPMRWDATTSTLSFEGRQADNADPSETPKIFSVHLKFKG